MAEQNKSRNTDDQFIQTCISKISLWKKSPKKACPERSDVIDGVVRNQRADYLGVVVEHGWDVNEMLQVYGSGRGRVKRTALHHAVYYRWHEGVRLLLNAGADCNIKCEWSGEADFSVPPDASNHFEPDVLNHVSLCVAIYKDDPDMVKLLLQNGADLQDSGCDYIVVNKKRLEIQKSMSADDNIEKKLTENSEVLNGLLTDGTNLKRNLDEKLHSLLKHYLYWSLFLREHLDVIFTHGLPIDKDYPGHTLYPAFVTESPINAIRWLIRHGACCGFSLFPMLCRASIKYRMLWDDAFLIQSIQRYKLPLLDLVLQVGIKPADSLKVHLGELERIIHAYLQHGESGDQDDDIIRKTASIYQYILNAEERKRKLDDRNAFPIDREQQMAHLREFSDHSLDIYPEELNMMGNKRERWEQTLKMVSNLLHFLNEPRTLQWHCRVCLRESLVSLSPSVIRNLSVPAPLKRYILCHEL